MLALAAASSEEDFSSVTTLERQIQMPISRVLNPSLLPLLQLFVCLLSRPLYMRSLEE